MVAVDDSVQERGVRFLGIFFCAILLFLVELPFRGIFFYKSVVMEKEKPSRLDRFTAMIFGKKTPIRPDYVYLLLWVFLLAFSLRNLDSEGILNTRRRCSVDEGDVACTEFDFAQITRQTGDYAVGLGQHR